MGQEWGQTGGALRLGLTNRSGMGSDYTAPRSHHPGTSPSVQSSGYSLLPVLSRGTGIPQTGVGGAEQRGPPLSR